MISLLLHSFHEAQDARFADLDGAEVVDHYGDALAEHAALRNTAGVVDLSFRSRLCVIGVDRARFLHGQVTNSVNDLRPGQGCYAALVTTKGKLESDLNIHCLRDELLLDFEPGLSRCVQDRLDRYVVADDVQLVDVAPLYGMLGVLGPEAARVMARCGFGTVPPAPQASVVENHPVFGEVVLANHPRGATAGFELFVPVAALADVAEKLIAAARELGGRPCGWRALEMIRIEAGLPRFGCDMDETNLASEAGIEARAISYTKGCYIGQEVINRLRTFAQVSKALRGLQLADELKQLPARGDKLFHGEREAGYITSALASPTFGRNIALGYVRKECNEVGTELALHTTDGASPVKIVPLPFSR